MQDSTQLLQQYGDGDEGADGDHNDNTNSGIDISICRVYHNNMTL